MSAEKEILQLPSAHYPPDRKGEAKTFEWHGMDESPSTLRLKPMESFSDKVPANGELQVGYIARRGNGKRWIEQQADLTSMYKQFDNSESITFFCEGRRDSIPTGSKRKWKSAEAMSSKSSYDDHEDEVLCS